MIAEVEPFPGLKRSLQFVDELHKRAARMAVILEDASIPYAVVGGLAVGEWVGRMNLGGVRYTKDIDILVRRSDLDRIKAAMEAGGFVFGNAMDVDFFMDGPNGTVRDGIHLLYSGEKVKPTDLAPAPDVSAWQPAEKYRVIGLQEIVTMKLTSYRDKDRTHLRDMIGVGLINATWPARFAPPLAARLQAILDDPDG